MTQVADLDRSDTLADASAKPFVNVNVITPKPDRFEEFMALQLAQVQRLRGQVEGLLGSRMFRSLDDRNVVLVSVFATSADAARWREDQRLIEHMARVRPLIESAMPGAYQVAYEVGVV